MKMVDTVPVEIADPSKKTSEILGPSSDEATVQMAEMDRKCYWNNVEYEQEVKISTNGKHYSCSFGKWVPLD